VSLIAVGAASTQERATRLNMMRSVAALLVAVQLGLLLSVTSGAVPHFVCPASRAERTPFPEDLVFERDNCRVEAPKISTTNLDTATRGIIYQVSA
jgi:hypothetical protein